MADALDQAGRPEEAASAFVDFEKQARAVILRAGNANRELIFFYADRAQKPEEALRLARQEILLRHDVYTLDAYAWALYANREYAEARRQIEKALAVGIRDLGMVHRAEVIHSAPHESDAPLTGNGDLRK